jgi:ATP-dependent DNA helicase RecG
MHMMESKTIEFKKSLAELSDGLNSIAAILNKHGSGELWFGIRNDGRPAGMDVSETTLRKVSQAIAAHIEPKIYPEVSQVPLDGKSCIRVSFSGNEKPCYAHGRAYMRVADEDRQLTAKEIESIILRKNRSHRGWDSEPMQEGSFKPDTAKIRAYVRKAGLPWTNTKDTLENLGLYVDGHYLNAARVFFSKSSPMTVRCAVFGTHTTATLIDQHDFSGDILTLIEEAEKYILKNIRIGMRLDGLVRVNVPEIDRDAFREAINNAFCHRDYRDPDEVRIAVFPDRVEVRNPGTLMEGVTLRSLRTAKVSRRRNPLIADLLRRIQYIEAWGRGIPLILEKAPNVRFSQVAGIFITEFPRLVADGEVAEEVTAPVTPQVTAQVTAQVAAFCQDPRSSKEIMELLGLRHWKTFQRNYLNPLLAAGLIERTIPEKPNSSLQKYRLTAKGRSFLS